jgi:cell division GTPase FtsZ
MDENLDLGISFDLPKNQSNVIKAIGVGGGGSNAINHMYRQGIKGVERETRNKSQIGKREKRRRGQPQR